MATYRELRRSAEFKGLQNETNVVKRIGDSIIIYELGIKISDKTYTWAWFEFTVFLKEGNKLDSTYGFFRSTYDQRNGKERKGFSHGFDIEKRILKNVPEDVFQNEIQEHEIPERTELGNLKEGDRFSLPGRDAILVHAGRSKNDPKIVLWYYQVNPSLETTGYSEDLEVNIVKG